MGSSYCKTGPLYLKIKYNLRVLNFATLPENRLTVERLKDCADVLGVSMNYFFIDKNGPFNTEDNELLQLVSEFYSVPSDVRVEFLALVRKLRQFSQQYQNSYSEVEETD
ncbi:MAG: hypothetical protein CL561_00920 [Alphaproteobacteria bacterium]|nr:hypothetical protein [Alphaproteobacteria bacterium]|tara:strand:+ start:113745 stop:114074 length:330 start_codon:yes stop_codon:yes gene_type:complete